MGRCLGALQGSLAARFGLVSLGRRGASGERWRKRRTGWRWILGSAADVDIWSVLFVVRVEIWLVAVSLLVSCVIRLEMNGLAPVGKWRIVQSSSMIHTNKIIHRNPPNPWNWDPVSVVYKSEHRMFDIPDVALARRQSNAYPAKNFDS